MQNFIYICSNNPCDSDCYNPCDNPGIENFKNYIKFLHKNLKNDYLGFMSVYLDR